MAGGLYIFKNANEFAKVIDDLQKQYNSSNGKRFELYKELSSMKSIRNEINFLNRCKINAYSGFRSKKQIKVNLTDNYNCIYLITYDFNKKSTHHLYEEFKRYLKGREWSNI